MAVSSLKLCGVRGDTNTWVFPYTGTLVSAVFVVTNPATTTEIFSKTLGNGISEVAGGLEVSLAQTDLSYLPPVLTVLSYFLRITEAAEVTTLAAGAIYIYAAC